MAKAATRARADVDALWRLVTGGLPLGLATRVPRGSGQPGRRLAAPRRRCGRSAASRAHRACGRMSGHTGLAGRPVRPPERPGRSGTAQPDRNRPGTRRSDSPEGLPGPSNRWSTGRRRSRLRGPVGVLLGILDCAAAVAGPRASVLGGGSALFGLYVAQFSPGWAIQLWDGASRKCPGRSPLTSHYGIGFQGDVGGLRGTDELPRAPTGSPGSGLTPDRADSATTWSESQRVQSPGVFVGGDLSAGVPLVQHLPRPGPTIRIRRR